MNDDVHSVPASSKGLSENKGRVSGDFNFGLFHE